jgi:hypothetical protein
MAKRTVRRSMQMVPIRASAPARRAPGVSKAKFEKAKARAASAVKRAKEGNIVGDALAIGGAAAFGWARQKEHIPERFGAVDSGLIIGGGLLAVSLFVSGKMGKYAGDVGVGVASTAAYRFARGAPISVESSKGEWE